MSESKLPDHIQAELNALRNIEKEIAILTPSARLRALEWLRHWIDELNKTPTQRRLAIKERLESCYREHSRLMKELAEIKD